MCLPPGLYLMYLYGPYSCSIWALHTLIYIYMLTRLLCGREELLSPCYKWGTEWLVQDHTEGLWWSRREPFIICNPSTHNKVLQNRLIINKHLRNVVSFVALLKLFNVFLWWGENKAWAQCIINYCKKCSSNGYISQCLFPPVSKQYF